MVESPGACRRLNSLCSRCSPADKICACVSTSAASGKYKSYVLLLLVLTCLLSQLHRFVLIATNVSMAQELKFGDSKLLAPPVGNTSVQLHNNASSVSYHTECSDLPETCSMKSNSSRASERIYQGTGMEYQVLAGPVFILIYAASYIPLGVLAGLRSVNRAAVLSTLVMVWSVVTMLCGLSQQYWQVAFSRMALGVFVAGCNPFAASIISDYFEPNQRGVAMALYTLGIYIGFSISFLLIMADNLIGWRYTYFAAGAPGILVGLLILFTVREPARPHVPTKMKKRNGEVSGCNRDMMALCDPLLVLFCVAAAFRCGGGYVWAYNLRNFFNQYHGDARVELYMSWIPAVFGALGSVLGGAASDMLSRRWGFTARFGVLVVSQIIAAPFQVGSLYLDPPWALLMQIPTVFFAEMWMGVAMVIIMDLVPINLRALAISIFFFTLNVIGGNLNVLVPPLSHTFGLRVALFLTIPLFYWIAAVLFAIIWLLLRHSINKQDDKTKYQPQLHNCLDRKNNDSVSKTDPEVKTEFV